MPSTSYAPQPQRNEWAAKMAELLHKVSMAMSDAIGVPPLTAGNPITLYQTLYNNF
jgi:hypothetical protein